MADLRTVASAESIETRTVTSESWSGTSDFVRETAVVDLHAPPPEEFALVDFGLVGESRWIEALAAGIGGSDNARVGRLDDVDGVSGAGR